ncbi:MAG TPA: nucleotide exchange factor GrpE [Vicinamibacteria bacterium]|nr:nucleotide exchange factor GrpE [Vicinamibacteria bacterium]
MGEDPVDDPVGIAARDDAGEPEPPAEPAEPAPVLEAPAPGQPSESLEQRARAAEERLAEVTAAYKKLRTENEGFRARVTRELERQFDRQREKLVLQFIEILDNLDRALEAAESSYAGNPLIQGLILVRTQLLQMLKQEGLERVPVLGLPYDPAVSEAVATQPVGDHERDHLVLVEMQRGYRLHGRVVRASRVVVGAYQESAVEPSPDSSELIGADELRARAAEQPAADTRPVEKVAADKPAAARPAAEQPAAEEPVTPRLFDQADLDEMLGSVPVVPRKGE